MSRVVVARVVPVRLSIVPIYRTGSHSDIEFGGPLVFEIQRDRVGQISFVDV